MDVYTLLIIGHLIGTVLGVGGATMIEIHLNQALRDKEMNPMEKSYLKTDFLITRIGMTLGILTGIGFLVIYVLNGQYFRLQNPILWAKLAIVLIIIINAILLHLHKVKLYWGSAFSLISWWGAFLFGIFLTEGVRFASPDRFNIPGGLIEFVTVIASYLIVVVIGAFILDKIRLKIQSNYRELRG